MSKRDLEMTVARKLVKAALDAGYTISVFDGEEWTVKKSSNAAKIIEALHSTESDSLRFRVGDVNVGSVWLIWGNSPAELMADYTDNPAMSALLGTDLHICGNHRSRLQGMICRATLTPR